MITRVIMMLIKYLRTRKEVSFFINKEVSRTTNASRQKTCFVKLSLPRRISETYVLPSIANDFLHVLKHFGML